LQVLLSSDFSDKFFKESVMQPQGVLKKVNFIVHNSLIAFLEEVDGRGTLQV
jgi:hypothetical protein